MIKNLTNKRVVVDTGGAALNPARMADDLVATSNPASGELALDIRSHAENVGTAIRSALEDLVISLAGPTPRPNQLIARVGLDKTLAGRIIQTVRSPDPLTALSRSPSPVGLEILLKGAHQAGARPESLTRMVEAVAGFERLLSRFPRGRAALDAAISGWMPETREQGERAARQASFKSMSFLLGYQSEVTLGSTILTPNADGETVDVAYVSGRYGLRRLRMGEPLSVFGTRYYPLSQDGDSRPNPTTLDGQSIDDASCLLPEFCDEDLPRLELVQTKDQRLLVLPADEPGLNEPISMVVAHMTKKSWRRYASPEQREEWQTILTRCPTRVIINDTFIHKDLYPGDDLVVTTHMMGVSPLPARERGPNFSLDEVHLSKEVSWVKTDLRNFGTGEVPRHSELMSSVFERLGADPADYRTHRLRMTYPVSGVVATRWFKLPDRLE